MSNRKGRSWAWLAALLLAGGAGVGCELWTHRSNPNKQAEDHVPVPKPVMDDGQRGYLWDIESHGNQLARTNYGLKTLGNALSKADRKAFDDLLAADFQGEILGKPWEKIRISNDSCE